MDANRAHERTLTGWLESIPSFLEQLQRHRHTDNLALASTLSGRCDDYLSLLQALLTRTEEIMRSSDECDGLQQLMDGFSSLAASINSLAEHYREWCLRLTDSESEDTVGIGVPQQVYRTGARGRPPYHIPQSQLEALIELRFSYETIARLLHVSTRTLYRRRMLYGLPSGRCYTDVEDTQLDDIIRDILQVCLCVCVCARAYMCVRVCV